MAQTKLYTLKQLEKKYPLDWCGLWVKFEGEPHLTMRDGRVLRLQPSPLAYCAFHITLQLLTLNGWTDLRTKSIGWDAKASPSEITLLTNSAYHSLMQYAEYLFAGQTPGPEQQNTFPKWLFSVEAK